MEGLAGVYPILIRDGMGQPDCIQYGIGDGIGLAGVYPYLVRLMEWVSRSYPILIRDGMG